jgi:hypothetical protein
MKRFWAWYERHYTLNISIAAGLFVLQLLHLWWLGADVIALRLFDQSYWDPSAGVEWALYVVDYTEIPVLVSVSLVYVNTLRKGFDVKAFLLLAFLNTQWLHIFWITDEFVVSSFSGQAAVSSLPGWLAWVAILIDYLELPVIYDTMRRMVAALRERRVGDALAAAARGGLGAAEGERGPGGGSGSPPRRPPRARALVGRRLERRVPRVAGQRAEAQELVGGVQERVGGAHGRAVGVTRPPSA